MDSEESSFFALDEFIFDMLTDKHREIFAAYVLKLKEEGPFAVRDMILGDTQRFCDLGAERMVVDLCVVLDCFLSEYPETGPQ